MCVECGSLGRGAVVSRAETRPEAGGLWERERYREGEGEKSEIEREREMNQEFDWGLWDFLGERERERRGERERERRRGFEVLTSLGRKKRGNLLGLLRSCVLLLEFGVWTLGSWKLEVGTKFQCMARVFLPAETVYLLRWTVICSSALPLIS